MVHETYDRFSARRKWKSKGVGTQRGITVLELLVVMATIGVLVALIFPAIQMVREAAHNTQCINNLHQTAHALEVYHDAHRCLPAGWQPDASNKSSYGWASSILNELEDAALSARISRRQCLSAVSAEVRSTTPAVFVCPSDVGDGVFPLYAEIGEHAGHAQDSSEVLVTLPRANYIGVFGTTDPDDVPGSSGCGLFIKGKGHRFSEVSRGLSHVVSVGERTTRKLPSTWLGVDVEGEDAVGRLVGYSDVGPNRSDADECEFDSRHLSHVNFAWADGHVTGVNDDIERPTYRQFAELR
jgi:prepilin-type processing-associated H-X9-DG protein